MSKESAEKTMLRLRSETLLVACLCMLFLITGCSRMTDAQSLIDIGSVNLEPAVIEFVVPQLPDDLVWDGKDVSFELWFELNTNGVVGETGYVAPSSDSHKYDKFDWREKVVEASTLAVKKWKFTPLVMNGVATEMVVDIGFIVANEAGEIRWIIKDIKGNVIFDSAKLKDIELPYIL